MNNSNDLISRAEAIEEMRRFSETMHDNRCKPNWYDAVGIIKDIPAVDAVPVVHGQWIDENPDDFLDPRMRCSICRVIASPLIKWRYCPNCGAKNEGVN